MFIGILFKIVKSGIILDVWECGTRRWDFFSFIKKNEVQNFSEKWMHLENILLISVAGPQRHKLHAISLMGIYLEVEECDQEFQISHVWSNAPMDQEF